jgi:F0F1-type ATP synthase membrane subunit b/b'
MRLPWRKRERPVSRELAEARRQREMAEQQLADAREHVIIPLRELREKNHIGQLISELIQRHVERGGT